MRNHDPEDCYPNRVVRVTWVSESINEMYEIKVIDKDAPETPLASALVTAHLATVQRLAEGLQHEYLAAEVEPLWENGTLEQTHPAFHEGSRKTKILERARSDYRHNHSRPNSKHATYHEYRRREKRYKYPSITKEGEQMTQLELFDEYIDPDWN